MGFWSKVVVSRGRPYFYPLQADALEGPHGCVEETGQASKWRGSRIEVAEVVLRGRLTSCKSVVVSVDSTPPEILGGLVRGVKVQGKGWSTPLRLSCTELDVSVGRT